MQLLCWFLEVISKALSHLFVLFFPSTKNNLNYQKYSEKDRSKIGKCQLKWIYCMCTKIYSSVNIFITMQYP